MNNDSTYSSRVPSLHDAYMSTKQNSTDTAVVPCSAVRTCCAVVRRVRMIVVVEAREKYCESVRFREEKFKSCLMSYMVDMISTCGG